MSLRGYVRKTKPALWTTVPKEARRREAAALELARAKAAERKARTTAKGWRRIRPVSVRRRGELAEYRRAARLFVEEERAAGNRCVVVNTVPELSVLLALGIVSDELTDNHHIRGRSGKMLMDRRWWMAVSRAGHDWIRDNPVEAAERGWLAGMGEWLSAQKKVEKEFDGGADGV